MPRRDVIACCAVAWLLSIGPPWVTRASGGVVGGEPVASIAVVRVQREAQEALEKSLPGAGGRLFLVSPHDYLLSLLLPLRRSGPLKELVTLLPADNVLVQTHLEEARNFMEKAGVAKGDLGSLHLEDGAILGIIEGMPITMSTLTSLGRQEGHTVLVVDTAFFPAVYRNEVKTPMVDLAWKLVVTLRERKVRADAVVLFDATGRGDFPLEHGFLARLLKEMLSNPGTFANGPPVEWGVLKAADAAYFFAQYPEAMELYRVYLGEVPSDASACYKISQMAARDLDVDLVLHWLNRAVSIDPFYRRAYSEAAGYFFRKDLFDASERILLAGLSKFPKDPLLATNLAALYLSRGELFREVGNGNAAAEYYRLAAGVEGAESAMRDRARRMLPPESDPPPK